MGLLIDMTKLVVGRDAGLSVGVEVDCGFVFVASLGSGCVLVVQRCLLSRSKIDASLLSESE